MNSVIPFISKKAYIPYADIARNACLKALRILKKKGTLELHIVTNAEMSALSKQTRGKDGATNVLSFEAHGFPRLDVKHYLGEVYLAPDFIRTKKQDIELLAVHGVLHLLQYTHKTKHDRIVMERVEDEILSRIAKS